MTNTKITNTKAQEVISACRPDTQKPGWIPREQRKTILLLSDDMR